jgi:hypothetical protein
VPSLSSPGATSAPGTTGSTASNGTQLGSYDVKLPPSFSVPRAAAAPPACHCLEEHLLSPAANLSLAGSQAISGATPPRGTWVR